MVRLLVANDIDAVERILRNMANQSPDNSEAAQRVNFHALMLACAKVGCPKAVGWCFSQLLLVGFVPDEDTFAMMIRTCETGEGDVSLAELLWDINSFIGVKPPLTAYQSMINLCLRADDAHRSEKWMQHLSTDDTYPRIVAYTTILESLTNFGNMVATEAWVSRMQQEKVEPDAVIYNMLISGSAKAGKRQRAQYWFNLMVVKNNMVPSHTTYNSLIAASARMGSLHEVEKWIGRMKQAEYTMTAETFDALILANAQVDNIAKAKQLMTEMRKAGFHPNVECFSILQTSYNKMIDKVLRASDLQATLCLLEDMVLSGIHPDSATHEALLNGCFLFGDNTLSFGTLRLALSTIFESYRKIGDDGAARHWMAKKLQVEAQWERSCKMRDVPIWDSIQSRGRVATHLKAAVCPTTLPSNPRKQVLATSTKVAIHPTPPDQIFCPVESMKPVLATSELPWMRSMCEQNGGRSTCIPIVDTQRAYKHAEFSL